jgi:hypothetical protein
MNRKWILWKNNTGAGYGFSGGIIHFGLKGSPDIIGFDDKGTFIGIEVKTGNAKQNKHQKAFQEACKLHGAKYYLVKPGIIYEKLFVSGS